MTLYQTFEWTYNLLSEEAQKLFRRLSYFRMTEEDPLTDIDEGLPDVEFICSIDEDFSSYFSRKFYEAYCYRNYRYVSQNDYNHNRIKRITQILKDYHLLEEVDVSQRPRSYYRRYATKGIYMLQIIHEYAKQKLIETGEDKIIEHQAYEYEQIFID